MVLRMTPDEFIETYNGKAIDDDGAYGVQCVDLYRVFCRWIGIAPYPTGTGWADGYWINRNSEAESYDNFDFIEDSGLLQKGDWCFWHRGSASCPSSHVAMFVEYNGDGSAKFFGQNQTADRHACIVNIPLDISGAFRWKGWDAKMEVLTQATVLVNNLNIRQSPSLSGAIRKQAMQGETYDVFGVVQHDGYRWLQLADGWMACTAEWVSFPDDDKSDLETKIDGLLYIIGKATNELETALKTLKGD